MSFHDNRRDFKIETWHYIIICQIYQLHDEEKKRKELRRIISEVSTIKINESFDDICVIQSRLEPRAKIDKNTKSHKFVKITKQSRRFVTLVEKLNREKRRQFKNEIITQSKRLKCDEFFEKDEEIIFHVFDESNIESRKTRVQTRRKIFQELKKIITIEK